MSSQGQESKLDITKQEENEKLAIKYSKAINQMLRDSKFNLVTVGVSQLIDLVVRIHFERMSDNMIADCLLDLSEYYRDNSEDYDRLSVNHPEIN